MPGRPRVWRLISLDRVPSCWNNALRKVGMSARGWMDGSCAWLLPALDPRLWRDDESRLTCRDCAGYEYGEYNLVLWTCLEVWAGWWGVSDVISGTGRYWEKEWRDDAECPAGLTGLCLDGEGGPEPAVLGGALDLKSSTRSSVCRDPGGTDDDDAERPRDERF